jgi:hypothetical protein
LSIAPVTPRAENLYALFLAGIFMADFGGAWAGSRRACLKSAANRALFGSGGLQAGGERLSRACVIEKNLAWSDLGQYRCLNFSRKPGAGIAAQGGRRDAKD